MTKNIGASPFKKSPDITIEGLKPLEYLCSIAREVWRITSHFPSCVENLLSIPPLTDNQEKADSSPDNTTTDVD